MPKPRIFYSTKDAHSFLKDGAAVAIGNFDGVHHGHRVLLDELVKNAAACKLKPVLLTFDPHPVKILAPDVAPPLINTLNQKIELLAKTGLSAVVIQPFDKNFAKVRPEAFFDQFLVRDLGARFLVVGYDFTFGENRSGTIETLEVLGYQKHVAVKIMDAQMVDGMLASSTVIRRLVTEGQFDRARELLTRPFFIDGTVVQGYHRGTALGLHTANLKTDNELIPANGVYATLVELDGGTYRSATNIGYNPTFDNPERSIETHIFDFDRNIVGRQLRLIFAKKLRDEVKFATPEALVTQIKKDIENAKKVLKRFK